MIFFWFSSVPSHHLCCFISHSSNCFESYFLLRFCAFHIYLLTPCLFRFLSLVGGNVDQIGSTELRLCVENKVKTSCVEELAKAVDTTPETLRLIIDGLTQPPGFDIRQSKTCSTHLHNLFNPCCDT